MIFKVNLIKTTSSHRRLNVDRFYFPFINQWRGIYDINADPDLDTTVDDGKWHTVAITYDMKIYRVYIDGKLEAEKKITDKPDTADMTLTIGSWHGGGWLNGLIDELYLSRKALSESEVQKFSSGIATASAVYPQQKIAMTWGSIKYEDKNVSRIKKEK